MIYADFGSILVPKDHRKQSLILPNIKNILFAVLPMN